MDTSIDKCPVELKENQEENDLILEVSNIAVEQSSSTSEKDKCIDGSFSSQTNLKGGAVDGTKILNRGLANVSETIAEIEGLPKYSCALCLQKFSRASSLSMHMVRKHPPLINKTKKLKRPATVQLASNQKDPKRKRKPTEDSFIEVEKTNEKQLQVVLGNKLHLLKKEFSDETETKKSLPASPQEEAVLQNIKDSCKKLQDMGINSVVITADPGHSRWFGSGYGLEFAQDHVEVISSFFNYCKDKNDAFQKANEMKKRKEKTNTSKDLKFIMECDTDDNNLKVKEDRGEDPEVKMVCEDDVEDDDVAADDDEADFYDDGNDKQHEAKGIQEPYSQYLESREKLFEELTAGLMDVEDTRDVSSLLRKTVQEGTTRPVDFTVEELNRGKYKCSSCGYNFLWKCHLELHQIKNPYCSRVTSFKASKKDVLKESITFENPETGVQITSTFQDLLDSQTVHPITCAICRKSQFRDRGMLARHIVTHNQAKIYECNICCVGYSIFGHLSTHLRNHFRKSYECQRCQWSFSDALKLQRHTESGCQTVSLINNKEKDTSFETTVYKCDVCSKEVIGVAGLRDHLTSVHDKTFGKYDCVLCDKKFPDTRNYNRHLMTHNKKFPCPFCPKKFGTRSDLFYQHMKTHKETCEYPYVCDICGEKFKKKRYLDPHLRIHTGERPYMCEEETCPVHKKKNRRYCAEALLDAYRAVKDKGLSVKRAAKEFKVPQQTLRDRVIGRVDPLGFMRENCFTPEEELSLVEQAETLDKLGYGFSNIQLKQAGGELAFELGKRDSNKALSNRWLYGFFKRWEDRLKPIRMSKPDSNSEESMTPEYVRKYFDNLQTIFDVYDLHNKPHNVYNLEETGLQLGHTLTEHIASLNSNAKALSSPRSTVATLIACANAAGDSLPPFLIFQGKTFNPEITQGATTGTGHEMSNSGWPNSKTYKKYLEDHFIPNAEKQLNSDSPALIIYDGHTTHVNATITRWARENDIIFVALPAHTSYLLQPLCLGTFGAFKSLYDTECTVYMNKQKYKDITQFDVCNLACKAYRKTMTPVNIMSGFKTTGVFPLDPEVQGQKLLLEDTPLELQIVQGDEADVMVELQYEEQTSEEEENDCCK